MKISYNWLQSFFNKKLPQPKRLAGLLSLHIFETEVVGQIKQDYVLDVDVLPNRAHDCLGHIGIAREIGAILDYPVNLVDYGKKIKSDQKEQAKNLIQAKVEDKNLCPRYTARIMTDIKVGSSPKWIQERLKNCGLKPINNIVDIVNYVMLETGQPMHAFDFDKIASEARSEVEPPKSDFGGSTSECRAKTLIIRRAKKGEKIVSLDNEEYKLDENILVIADKEKSLCIAGIKGGKDAEIAQNTKRVVLEAANFSSQIIRSAFNRLKLRTDASWRFENQLDPNLTVPAMEMAVYLIQDIVSGQALRGIVDVYPNKIKPKTVKLNTEKVRSLLGVNISDKEIITILKKLGFVKIGTVPLKEGLSLLVTVPTARLDISIQEDLIEEVGRLYGFEKIPSRLPSAVLIPPKRNDNLVYQNRVKDILVNLGFSETYNYSFIDDKEVGYYGRKLRPIEISNPISQEQKYLRSDLMPNLLNNIKSNSKYFKEIRLFEIGRVFQRTANSESACNVVAGAGRQRTIEETKKLGVILSLGNKSKDAREFYRLKGVVDSLLNKLGITDQWYNDQIAQSSLIPLSIYHSDRQAEVKVGNDCLGWLGEISKEALKKTGIKSKAAGFELNFEKIVELANEERTYLSPSKYPAVVRDIALLVNPGTKIVEVLNLIHSAGGPLISDIDLFDMYEGGEIPNDKKSLAFHIIFQADDHTLTDKEVNVLQEKIIRALEEEGEWEVRKQK